MKRPRKKLQSTRYHWLNYIDKAETESLAPDDLAPFHFADYAMGRDKALEHILELQPRTDQR